MPRAQFLAIIQHCEFIRYMLPKTADQSVFTLQNMPIKPILQRSSSDSLLACTACFFRVRCGLLVLYAADRTACQCDADDQQQHQPDCAQSVLIIPRSGKHQSETRKAVIRIKERTNPKRGTHQSAQGTHLPLRS